MTNPLQEGESLTGQWHGHYTQYGDKRRVIAVISQQDDRITGTMTDLDTETERSLYDAVAKSGLQPGADEQIDEQIRRMVPDAGDQPIKIRTILPEGSKVEGAVSGEFVRFNKLYQGESYHGYEVGDKGIGRTTPGHAVEYSGRLSKDRNTISGRWTIYQADAPNGFIDGSFELKRAVDAL